MSARTSEPAKFDAIVVGAGVGGLYAIHRLRELGLKVRAFEAAGGAGGTWYWDRYPGCRCDVESMEYSYSFSDELQQEWHWPERYGRGVGHFWTQQERAAEVNTAMIDFPRGLSSQ